MNIFAASMVTLMAYNVLGPSDSMLRMRDANMASQKVLARERRSAMTAKWFLLSIYTLSVCVFIDRGDVRVRRCRLRCSERLKRLPQQRQTWSLAVADGDSAFRRLSPLKDQVENKCWSIVLQAGFPHSSCDPRNYSSPPALDGRLWEGKKEVGVSEDAVLSSGELQRS
jgi:hypothetical protein